MLLLLVCQLSSIYKIRKKNFIYKKYMYNLCQNDFNLLTNYIYTKIQIIPIINTDFLGVNITYLCKELHAA